MRKRSRKKLRLKELSIHIIIWIGIASFLLFVFPSIYDKLKAAISPYLLLCLVLFFYLNYSLLAPRLLLRKKTWSYLFVSILFVIIIHLGVVSLSSTIKIDQFDEINSILEKVNFRNLQYFILTFATLLFFISGGVLRLIKDFYKTDEVQKHIEMQRAETELEFLKSQLNPHFLFNSLNSVYSLVRNQSKEAPQAVITLSELMRYMLYEANQSIVEMEKELNYIKNYVALQRLRISNNENVKLHIKGDYSDKMIVPLLLITFIENAFKYGTDYKGRTKVDIKIELKEDHLHFLIVNLIGVQNVDEVNSGIGLKNVENRLDYLYPKAHALAIEKSNGEYVVNLYITLSKSVPK